MNEEQRPLGGGGALGTVRAFVVWWVLCAALWLALIDRTPLPGLITGAVAATLGAVAAVLVRSQRQTVLRPRLRWARTLHAPLASFITDVGPLVRGLFTRGVLRRQQTGELFELPFDATAENPRDAAYRVFTAALGSLGPNTIVVHIDRERGVLVAHQLRPTPDPAAKAMPLPEP